MRCALSAFAAASAALFTAGCRTDLGIYYENQSFFRCSEKSEKLRRSFDLPEPKDVIAPLGRDALAGTWRILVEDTTRAVCPSGTSGKDRLSGSAWSTWKLEEWNFAPDGRYTMRLCAKSSGKPIASTGEDGTWTYDGGVLTIDAGCMNFPSRFFGTARLDCAGKKRLAFDLIWHSAHEFTAKCRDADAYAKSIYGAAGKGSFDADGCIRFESSIGSWNCPEEIERVISPLRFRSMDDLLR